MAHTLLAVLVLMFAWPALGMELDREADETGRLLFRLGDLGYPDGSASEAICAYLDIPGTTENPNPNDVRLGCHVPSDGVYDEAAAEPIVNLLVVNVDLVRAQDQEPCVEGDASSTCPLVGFRACNQYGYESYASPGDRQGCSDYGSNYARVFVPVIEDPPEPEPGPDDPVPLAPILISP